MIRRHHSRSRRMLALAGTSMLVLPIAAQMSMPMDHAHMPGMSTPAPAPAPQKQQTEHVAERQRPQQPQGSAAAPAMPFGTTADRRPDGPQQPLPATPSPVRLDLSIQEQEHPEHGSGSAGSAGAAMPALLTDARGRTPLPLSHFQQLALTGNPTLGAAAAQVRRLRAEAKQAGLWANPEIGYEADHVRGGSYHSGEQGGYVQQTIPLAGQRSALRAAVQQQSFQAEAVLAAQQARVRASVAQAFYAALALQSEVELRTQLATLAADATVTTHQLGNIGQADAPDMLQSEVEREQAKLDLATAQRAYRKAFVALAAMSGDAGMPVTLLEGDLDAVPQLDEAAWQQAADSSPVLQSAQAGVAAGEAGVRSARRQALPQLTLHAGLQQDNEPLESASGRVGVVGVAQAGITVPLWNRNQGAVEAARAGVLGAQAEAKRTELQVRMQAAQAMQDYSNAVQQAQRYREELLPRAARAYELYRKKYAAMAAAYPQVLLSQRTLFQLQIEYVHALNQAWQSAILLQNGLQADGLSAPAQRGE